jgi:hypothetical protein
MRCREGGAARREEEEEIPSALAMRDERVWGLGFRVYG